MPISDNDPRVFFAAERTLLAWIRTAIGLIGLGFVVARFGLFLRLVRQHDGADMGYHLPSVVLGIALSLLGAFAAGLATWQHRRFCRTLGDRDLPPGYRIGVGSAFGLAVAAAGVVLAVEMML
jgi:putative membrane protein